MRLSYIYIYRSVSTQSAISLLVQRLGMKGIGFKYKSNGARSVYGATSGGDKNNTNLFRCCNK